MKDEWSTCIYPHVMFIKLYFSRAIFLYEFVMIIDKATAILVCDEIMWACRGIKLPRRIPCLSQLYQNPITA